MNTPDHRPGMPWPAYSPPTVESLLHFIESVPQPPPTRLTRTRRLLWWAADQASERGRYRLSCLLHDIGWRLP